MKTFRKITALVLAAIMVLAMSVVSLAAAPTSGTIKVTKNYEGQTYKLYKIFDANVSYAEDGTLKAITYSLPTGKTDLGAGTEWFKINANGFVEVKDNTVTDDWAKDPDAIAWATSFGTQEGSAITASSDDDTAVQWTGLDWGYYFVSSSLGSFIAIDTTKAVGEVEDKNVLPTLDKEITAVTGTHDIATATSSDYTGDIGEGANEFAIAQGGATVSFSLTVGAKPGAKAYVVTDTLDAGLTAPAAADVSVSNATTAIAAADYSVNVSGQTITVTFEQDYLDKITAAQDIVITYDAVLNEDAVSGAEGNWNEATLVWGDGSDANKTSDESAVFMAKFDAVKKITDENGDPFPDAQFKLKMGNDYYAYDDATGVVSWGTIDAAKVFTSGEDGAIPTIVGLTTGSYTLEEVFVPDGYNKTEDAAFTVAADYTQGNLEQSGTVINLPGVLLPTTGGIGTTLFYILGSILVVGAGVLLVTRKRMSE